jgi:hypothetical protein
VDAHRHKDHFPARSGPSHDGDHEGAPSTDKKDYVTKFSTSSRRMREGLSDSLGRIARDPFVATGSASREVQAIATAFKSSNSKFSGDLDDSSTEYLREYDVVCRKLSLPPGRKFDLMHNRFCDDAKEWFFENITEKPPHAIDGYQSTADMLKAEYHSSARQERIKQILDCLTFEEFVEGPRTHQELKRALDKIEPRILKGTQQCEQAFRIYKHQLSHLRRAVIGQPCSELALQASPPFNNMNKLVAALGAAIQHDATKMAIQKTVARSSALPIFFQGQQQLRNPTYGKKKWKREKYVPAHKTDREGRTSNCFTRSHRGSRDTSKVRNRSWIDENTGLLKPDANGNIRSCNKCGGRNHLSFEVEYYDLLNSEKHIATRFATGDSMKNVFMDIPEDQLKPDEFNLLQESAEYVHEFQDADCVAAVFTQAFATKFLYRFDDRLSHAEGEDQ